MSDIVPDSQSSVEGRSIGSDLPVMITYSAVLKPGQSSRPTQQLYFKNPYRAPMWVDEIHFEVISSGDDDGTFTPSTPPQCVSMRLKLNNKFIVDDFTPLYLLAPHTDIAETAHFPSNFTTGKVNSFLYRFAKPMWVDELDDLLMELALNVDMVTLGFNSTQTPTVVVTLCGRSTVQENRPKVRYIPFNVHWGTGIFSADVATEFDKRSPDSALRNGRDVPVTITRMLGDVRAWPELTITVETNTSDSSMLLNLRISHSLGYYLVKDLTPFFELFQNVSREFAVKFVLQPKEFLTIELETGKLAEAVPSYIHNPTRYFGGFSLQGYETEALR